MKLKTPQTPAKPRQASIGKSTATEKPSRLRHRVDGGYARGDETRRRIIEAAIRLFGERGFEGTSTRGIAQQAGVNAPALQYYFDNKEGLYRACAEHIANNAVAHFSPALDRAQAALDTNADRDTLIEIFGLIQDTTADHLFASNDIQDKRLFVAHEQAGHGPGILIDIMDQGLRARMTQVCATLIARITGVPADDPLTLLRMTTLHGQLMIFHFIPKSALSALKWRDGIDAERLALLKRTVREQTRILMNAWSAQSALPL
ncbi:MAG TPA: CerR family C-terminal domain-containing protein [Rhodocyclaceae bacterium]|jgi:AcrR family transcriptional regulator|nr:CerR family C-terminal domain-containing protein [Rhodocyclaceae bacterium]